MTFMVTMGFSQILPSFGESRGLSSSEAAVLVSLYMLGNTLGKFSMGAESDRFGVLRVTVVAFLLPLIGFVLMLFETPAVYAAAFLSGMSMPAAMVVMPILIRDFYGSLRYERVYAFSSLVGNVALAMSGTIFGFVAERSGSYRLDICFCIVILSISVTILFLLLHGAHKSHQQGVKGGS